jgi:hypothetical protein
MLGPSLPEDRNRAGFFKKLYDGQSSKNKIVLKN